MNSIVWPCHTSEQLPHIFLIYQENILAILLTFIIIIIQ